MKKFLFFLLLAVCVLVIGDLLMILTGSGFIANFGSIVISAFFAGIFINILFKTEEKKFSKLVAISIGIIKIVLLVVFVNDPTLLAIIMMIILYPFLSYIFIRLGNRIFRA